MPRQTPLHAVHKRLRANLVEFAGYEMPLVYSSMKAEHEAVRKRAGIFDLSHMGEIHLHGKGADLAIDRIIAARLMNLPAGRARYGVICNEQGGIVDDVIAYRKDKDDWWVVVNAATRTRDLAWIGEHAKGVSVDDHSDQCALIAMQGPVACKLVAAQADPAILDLPPFAFTESSIAGKKVIVSRTGYTGEDGFELYLAAGDAEQVWETLEKPLLAAGGLPAGLGARDTLRLEAGLRLYGQDMDDSIDPVRCGLGWTVAWDKEFIGKEAVARAAAEPSRIQFVGLRLSPREIPRTGYTVIDSGNVVVGRVTSGTFSFTLGTAIATAYVGPPHGAVGEELTVDVRGRPARAEVVKLPFYRREGALPAGGKRQTES